jgi:hypothetical protein
LVKKERKKRGKLACFSKGSTNIKDVGEVTLNQVWGGGGKEEQFMWEQKRNKKNEKKRKNRKNPKSFVKNNKICSCFGWSSVCFGSIETSKLSVSV